MTPAGAGALPPAGTRLLEPAIDYALHSIQAIEPELLPCPTPCRGWNLLLLLRHASESVAALQEGIDAGRVGLIPAADDSDPAADPVQVFRDRACRLLDAWTSARRQRRVIAIAGHCVTLNLMAGAGALEIAVHGWDISRACGQRQPIPGPLAIELLRVAPLLVPGTGRHPLFAAPVTVTQGAGPSDRLAAFLGRSPRA